MNRQKHKVLSWKIATIVLLATLCLLAPLAIIQSQNLYTLRYILNDTWDKANHQLQTTANSGNANAQTFPETEITIFNDIWDASQHLIRVSGGGGAGSGTVTSVACGAGTGLSCSPSPITSTGTISGVNAAADGATKGVSAFTAADFNATSGVISIDYTNGQAASTSVKGFLTSTDWNTFNNKVATSRAVTIAGTANEITSSAGAQDLSADRTWTLSLPAAISLASHSLLIPSSTTLPATCTVAQIYFDTDATAGQNIYGCTATNTWTLQGDGGGAGSGITSLGGQTGATQTFTRGAGIGGTSSGDNHTFTVDSSEADFLTSGALTCGAATQGKMQVHTTPLQYCDNAATPVLQYAPYGDSIGRATGGTVPRAVTISSSSNSTVSNVDTTDIGVITLAENTTFANPSGTLKNGKGICYRIKSASVFTLAWGTNFRAGTSVALPTATTGSNKTDYHCFMQNSDDTKLDYTGQSLGF